jgi:ComF family protein
VRGLSGLGAFARTILDLLLPPSCGGCGREGVFFCGRCRGQLVPIASPCLRCGRPLPEAGRCGWCARWPLSWLDGVIAAYEFTGPLRSAVHAFKYRSYRALDGTLGALLSGAWEHVPPVELVVPIPLHPKREGQRGYNQATLLARSLARVVPLQVAEGVLVRVRETPSQARTANAEERRRQVQGAFRAGHELDGRRVVLVDDVCTTGATLDAAAEACKGAGAAAVYGLVLAREV